MPNRSIINDDYEDLPHQMAFIKKLKDVGERPLTPEECQQNDDAEINALFADLDALLIEEGLLPGTEEQQMAARVVVSEISHAKNDSTYKSPANTRFDETPEWADLNAFIDNQILIAKANENNCKPDIEKEAEIISEIVESADTESTKYQLMAESGKFKKLAERGRYDEAARLKLRGIAVKLTQLGVMPIDRKYPKFLHNNGAFKKYPQATLYMNDLRTFDLQWHHETQPGYKTNEREADGLFSGIYCGEVFNWEQAYRIAEGAYTDRNGKTNNLTDAKKIKALLLPECMQVELSILCNAKLKRRMTASKRKQYIEGDRIDDINVRSKDVKRRLEDDAKKPMSKIKTIDIPIYVSVWIAIERIGGDRSKLVEIIDAYEVLTSEPIGRSTLRRKIKVLKDRGLLARV